MVIHARMDPSGPGVICAYPPTPQNSLFFYINDRIKVQKDQETKFVLQPRSAIVGPQVSRVTLDINKDHKAVRVGFHPGGLYRLLGVPMHEMVDDHFDAEDVFGSEMREVNQRLQEAASFDAINEVITDFLLGQVKRLKRPMPFDLAMLELLKYNGNIPVEQLASAACLSLRQFERVSKERIGVPPKFFSRITRFSKAYRMRERSSELSWTSIAHECGYFDQMHFIRDFKEFAGVAPGIIEKELQQLPVRMQAQIPL